MSRIFISYRRDGEAGYAISIHDQLARRFGADQLFMDTADIEPGEDFVEVITDRISACDVILVLIGREWLTCKDKSGSRRLDNPDDYVRLEVASAIARKILVIPVLVGGASAPRPEDLPADLKPLGRRNAVALSDTRFRDGVARLIEVIEKVTRPGEDVRSPAEPKADVDDPVIGQERVLRGHAKPVKTVAFSPDSTLLASAGGGSWFGGGDTAIRLWRVSDGKLLHKLPDHQGTVTRVVFSPDGSLLASCCPKATLLWRISDWKLLRTLGSGANDIAFSRDGGRLVSWQRDEFDGHDPWEDDAIEYRLWSVVDGTLLGQGTCDDLFERTEFNWDRVSPDGRLVASSDTVKAADDDDDDGETEYRVIVLRSVSDESTIREFRIRNAGGVMHIVFSADGQMLANTHFSSPVVRLWRVSDGRLLAKVQWPETTFGSNAANSVALAPNGRWLATGCEDDRLVHVWPLMRSSESQ